VFSDDTERFFPRGEIVVKLMITSAVKLGFHHTLIATSSQVHCWNDLFSAWNLTYAEQIQDYTVKVKWLVAQ